MSYDIPLDDELDVRFADVEQLVETLRRSGIHEQAEISAQLDRLYHTGGLPRGELTGWSSVDELYTVAGGQWTLVTGIPGMGKSEWIDALMVNLAERGDWHFGIYSPENYPIASHAVKIIEKRARKPFSFGPTEHMTSGELDAHREWLYQRFRWIKPASEAPIEVICHALGYARGPGNFGVVIDPWNALDHYDQQWRPPQMSETEFVGDTLTRVTRLLRAPGNENVHLWISAHPAKLYRGNDGKFPMPSGYDVSGSAHWFNKADNIIVVHRDKADDSRGVDIAVQKVRFKHVGRVGVATLRYDRVTGRYFDAPKIRDKTTGSDEQYADPATLDD